MSVTEAAGPADADVVEVPDGYRVVDLPADPALGLSYVRALLTAGRGGGSAPELPRTVLRRTGVVPDARHVARYAALVGAAPGPDLPLLYPNTVSFGLQMALMTAPDFPFAAIGTVHLTNTVRRTRALPIGTALDVEVRAQNLLPHRLGRTFELVSVVRVDGEPVWTQVGTFLRRGSAPAEASVTGEASAPGEAPVTDPAPSGSSSGAGAQEDDVAWRPLTSWSLDAGLGRAFAAAAGDRNPIHLYPATARPFGFRTPIAHGMWTAARLTHAVDAGFGAAVTSTASFRKPVPLPSTVDVLVDRLPGEGAGPLRARVRRQKTDGAVCCDLVLAPVAPVTA